MEERVVRVPLDRIVADETGAEPDEWLLETLREEGLFVPVFLRELGDGRYQLLGDFRWLKGARVLGWEAMRSIIVPATEGGLCAAEQALLMDEMRKRLEALHKAKLARQAIDAGRGTQAELAKRLGIEPGNLSHMLKVLRFPDLVAAVEREGLPFSAARYLAALADVPRAALLDELRLLKGAGPRFLPVREIAARVQALKPRRKPSLRLARPPVLPDEQLPAAVAHLLAQRVAIHVEDAPEGQTEWRLQVPAAERERLAAMIDQHRAETEPAAEAA